MDLTARDPSKVPRCILRVNENKKAALKVEFLFGQDIFVTGPPLW